MKDFAERRLTRKIAGRCLLPVITVGAYARGNFLLGWDVGVAYALVAFAVALFVMQAAARRSSAPWQFVFVLAGAFVVGLILLFPTAVSSDIEVSIQKQAADRSVRAELYSLLESRPQYSALTLTPST